MDGYSIALGDAEGGCLVLSNLESGVHLSLLLIRPEYQRQGVGRRVIEQSIGQGRGGSPPYLPPVASTDTALHV